MVSQGKKPAIARGVDPYWHDLHDAFNLIVLPFVCGSNILYLTSMEESLLWIQFYLFTAYLIVDTVWVVLRPRSVASPPTIIVHHIVCVIGWITPHMTDPSLALWTSLGLTVEINTFFLIARRYWGRTMLIQILFYSTWIGLRVILFPVVLYLFIFKYLNYSNHLPTPTFFNTGLFILFIMVFLNGLNFKWTWDLFFKSQKQKSSHGGLWLFMRRKRRREYGNLR